MICSSLCRVPLTTLLLSAQNVTLANTASVTTLVQENSHSRWSSFWGLGHDNSQRLIESLLMPRTVPVPRLSMNVASSISYSSCSLLHMKHSERRPLSVTKQHAGTHSSQDVLIWYELSKLHLFPPSRNAHLSAFTVTSAVRPRGRLETQPGDIKARWQQGRY